jgi:hypothetical protein
MNDAASTSGKTWSYQFSSPDGSVLETGDFTGDDTAEARGRELSKSNDAPVVVHRHSGHVDAWEYVTEVDERA